eukprot:TRINITY_DN23673_c0_g1_i2.p1 TRINITY_DN23673_c0_g1~~TRINITY_DN23673_c0_g1_i2.p1  ORF type:complete len:479 (+),score=171.07 TRINITY_DN23673_c0_g1_i2:48-1439(+)
MLLRRAAATGARWATAIPGRSVAPGLREPTRKKVRIFNRDVKRTQRIHVAKLPLEECKLHGHVADIVMERLGYIMREFPVVMELGCGRGMLSKRYLEAKPEGLVKYIQCDMNQEMLDACYEATCDVIPEGATLEQYCIDEDENLPFPKRSVDLIISMLSLHWVNDIEATLKQARTILKQDGVILFCVFGGKTLAELQSCFTVAEQERDGGISPHINPFLTGPSMGDLLANAGFNFPTVDVDKFTFFWKTGFHLMEYLQMIGESSCLFGRRKFLSKDILLATTAVYDHLWYEEGLGVPSTFEIIHGVGWAPHPSHAEPSARGAGGSLSLKDIAEGLGEEIMSEESVQTMTDKKEKLIALLKNRGVRPENLRHLEELMSRRIAGDNSKELEEQIMAARNAIQANFDVKEATDVRHNLPTKDTTTPKQSYTKLYNESSSRIPDDTRITDTIERNARLMNPDRKDDE